MTNHPNRPTRARTLAVALREYRERHGLTQRALAADLGVPARSVENWEGKDGGGQSSMSRALIAFLDRA